MEALLVEDDNDVARLIQLYLSEIKVGVTHLDSGDKVAKHLDTQKHPDVILLDLMLPGKSGFEVIKDIKLSRRTKHIPVIIISSRRTVGDLEKCFNLGAKSYIMKPIDPDRLLDKVKEHMH